MFGVCIDDDIVVVYFSECGWVKQLLFKIGWFVEDFVGYVDGEVYLISLYQEGWQLCDYQWLVVDLFWVGGFGVVVLLCGVGKMLVGVVVMVKVGVMMLILVINIVVVW